jgi:hypothetical protein
MPALLRSKAGSPAARRFRIVRAVPEKRLIGRQLNVVGNPLKLHEVGLIKRANESRLSDQTENRL